MSDNFCGNIIKFINNKIIDNNENKINVEYVRKNKFTYKYVTNILNKIFKNIDTQIRNDILSSYGFKTRNTKLSFVDTLIFSFIYTNNHITKNNIVNDMNALQDKKNKISRTTYYDKENKIPLIFYKNIYTKLTDFYLELNDDSNDLDDNNIKKIIAIDGTFNNTNIFNVKGYLETCLNMGFFDTENDIPIDLTFEGLKTKANELHVLINYIKKNKTKFKNMIIILDRGYCSYDFINFLVKNNIEFVCRFKNKCNRYNKNEKIRTIRSTNTFDNTVFNNNVNKYTIDNKHFKSVVLRTEDDCTLVTNLDKNKYDDIAIQNLYVKRWRVEIFFKILKKNFKFEHLSLTNHEYTTTNYDIHYIKILIVYLLAKIFEKTYIHNNYISFNGKIYKRSFNDKEQNNDIKKINTNNNDNVDVNIKNNEKKDIQNNKINKNITSDSKNNKIIRKKIISDKKNKIYKNNKKKEINDNEIKIINVDINNNNKICVTKNNNVKTKMNKIVNDKCKECLIKVNKSSMIACVYFNIKSILKGELSEKIIRNTIDSYFTLYKVDPKIKNKRVCKTPFKKWYIKGYTHKSDLNKVVYKILGILNEELNKNLEMVYKKSKIIKINYEKK
jgi:hypothetical protein